MSDRVLDRPPFTAVGLLWPGPAPPRRVEPSPGSLRFRVVTSNALRTNKRADRWARSVLATDPDVLCVQELTPAIDGALRAGGLADVLPDGAAAVRAGSAGTGIWTRLPVKEAFVRNAGYALAVVRCEGVTVASVHTVAPDTRSKAPRWRRGFEVVEELVEETPGPIVVAGDFNATFAHGPMQALLRGGRLRDAHVAAGRARARTWPARFPVALLDHVLVSDEVGVRDVWEYRTPGSDHKAVVADLTVTPPA